MLRKAPAGGEGGGYPHMAAPEDSDAGAWAVSVFMGMTYPSAPRKCLGKQCQDWAVEMLIPGGSPQGWVIEEVEGKMRRKRRRREDMPEAHFLGVKGPEEAGCLPYHQAPGLFL